MIIRYSMIQDYLTCPKMFYDKHILGKLETTRSSALEYGSALHLGIRTALEGDDGIPAFNMYWNSVKDVHMQYYEHSWQDLKDLGEHFMNNFKVRHAKKFSEFRQEITMEMPFLRRLISDTYQGTADYIGLYEGKLTIADWKTSSRNYRKNKIEINSQLYGYAKLYQYNMGKLPEQIMYKVFNKKDGNINTIKKDLTQEYLDAIFLGVENAAKAMLRCIETKETYHGAECYCERV